MKFRYKRYNERGEKMLAISDASLVGKSFEEGELSLDVSKEFYSGNECDEPEALSMLKGSSIVNAVGREIIGLMLKEKIISKDNILTIKGVPHVQIVEIR